jgi:hypothetical protein
MNLLLTALSSVRSLLDERNLEFWRSALAEYSMIWYFLLLCALGVLLSRIAIEILAPSQQLPPDASNVARQLLQKSAFAQQAAPANLEYLDMAPADASFSEAMRQRLRALELQCDALRAEAQRSSRLEADLAAANIRIEQLTQMVSSKTVCTPCVPSADCAAAATPSFSDGTPLKFAHRTPSSAAKSLTVRASVLQKTQTTPSVALLQSR